MRDVLNSIGYDAWALPTLLILPILGAFVIRLLGRTTGEGDARSNVGWREVRFIALFFFTLEAVVSLGLWFGFDARQPGYQFVVDEPWIPDWGTSLRLGIDGISLPLILMTTILMPLTVLGSWTSVRKQVRSYYALLLVTMSGIIGVFVSLDLLLFYVMWELVLVPLYFIIGVWGGARRARASLKYFLYTFVGSLLMLLAIIGIAVASGSTRYEDAVAASSQMTVFGQLWLFGAFFLAFAVKSALFPFHTWLPDAQHEAPTTGAAALGIKVGTYGILRFALPLFPAAAMHPAVRTVIVGLAVVSILYGALVALVQPDFKRLVSYASISHLGFVMLGIFALTVESVQGSVMVMLSSGITTAAMFLLLGMLHERRRTGMIANFGGIARVVPLFSAFLILVSLSSIALPGTNGFVGEFLVMVGTYRTFPIAAIIAALGVIFAAAYLLWALQRVLFNPLTNEENLKLRDLNRRELSVMIVFTVAILWMGIAPGAVLRRMEASATQLVNEVQRGAGLASTRSAGSGSSTPAPVAP